MKRCLAATDRMLCVEDSLLRGPMPPSARTPTAPDAVMAAWSLAGPIARSLREHVSAGGGPFQMAHFHPLGHFGQRLPVSRPRGRRTRS